MTAHPRVIANRADFIVQLVPEDARVFLMHPSASYVAIYSSGAAIPTFLSFYCNLTISGQRACMQETSVACVPRLPRCDV